MGIRSNINEPVFGTVTSADRVRAVDAETGRAGVLTLGDMTSGGMFNVVTGITARAGGGQSEATAIAATAGIAVVGTVATGADSVRLPAAVPGRVIFLVNQGANSMQVFGAGTETINGIATGTGVAQAAGVAALYICAAAGAWRRILSA